MDQTNRSTPSSGSNFDIHVEEGMVVSEFFGVISPFDAVAHLRAVRHDSRFRPDMNTLADFRRATLKWSAQQIVEFRTLLFDSIPERLSGRWAVLADAGRLAEFRQLMENLFFRLDSALFHDEMAALQWIRAPRRRASDRKWAHVGTLG